MSQVRGALFFRCFLRSYLVSAAYNPLGLQNIGFLYAMDPALRVLFGPGEALRAARLRYARNYNCHPFLTPLLLGVLLRMETAIARGQLDPAVLVSLKDTTANTLSAIGDSFFNGTLLSTWVLTAACLLLADFPLAACLLTLAAFLLLQGFKLAGFILGVRKGMAVLIFLRKLDLINWGGRIKVLNAVLLCCVLRLALPGAPASVWAGTVLFLLLASWVVGRRHVSRMLVAFLLVGLIALLRFSGFFSQVPALFAGGPGM